MEVQKVMDTFFAAIQNDGTVTAAHIGVFAALIKYRIDCGWCNPVIAYSREIIPLTKISTVATYLKCIHDLHRLGLIRYEASMKCNQGSKIYFLDGHQ